MKHNTSIAAPARNLGLLCLLRGIVLACQTASIIYARYWLELPLAYAALLTTIGFVTIATLLALIRLKKAWPVTEPEFFSHLLIDIISLTILLYFTGGANNPFVSYFLVPVCISAATLRWRYTWIITGLSLLAYSAMLFYHVPLELLSPSHHHGDAGALNPHLLGMWMNFAISALLITYFVVRMARAIRDQEDILRRNREAATSNEHILGLAIQAAGAAHELATPLSTMSVLVNDLEHEQKDNPAINHELKLLKSQLDNCKNTLRKLAQTAELPTARSLKPQPVDRYFSELIDAWRIIRPDARDTFIMLASTPAPLINTDPTLTQAIQNLLNNAADASSEIIELSLGWNTDEIIFKIENRGAGIPMELADHIGKPFVTTKRDGPGIGLGLGLFLSHATVERHRGRIELVNRAGGGVCTTLTLPVPEKS